jgi:hypothetical protein
MDYANYWASAVATADLGETIEQSLRFRSDANANLSRTPSSSGNRQTWTYSFWYKPGIRTRAAGESGAGSVTFLCVKAAENNTDYAELILESDRLTLQGNTVSWFILNPRYRDPSAWYHYVLVCDTTNATAADRIRIYINGERITDFASSSNPSQNDQLGINMSSVHRIGRRADSNTNPLDGLMAEINFLDGTAIGDTGGVIDEFGRYQEDGVWVPKNYSGSYGTNGYNLDFADGSNPGNDVSGNNNDFTASGFDTADVALYTAGEAGSGTTYESNSANRTATLINPGSAFDGVTAGGTQVSMAGGGYWYLTHTINNVTGLRIMVKNDTSEIADTRVNGSTVTTTVSGDYIVVSSPPSTVTEVAIRRNQANTQVYQVEVNTGSGFTALLDNTDNDVDYLDTPTSNYGTWNPIHTAEGNKGAFTDANLQTANDSGGDYIAPSTIACGDGHWYWEVKVDGVQTTGYPMIGIFDYESAKPEWGGGTSNTEGCLYWTTGQFGAFVTQGSQSSYGATFTTGDIIGVEYNGSNGQLTFYKNGTSQGLATTVAASRRENMIPGVSAGNNGSAEVSVNFGQMDFSYTVPTGAKKLQTNNLPEPTIKKGNKHFGILTYQAPGSPSFPITIDGSGGNNGTGELDFDQSPDLVWIKMRNGSQNHVLFDTVRGATVSLRSDGTNSEITRSNFAFATNGFTFSAQDAESYQQNDQYVAWCWKAGGTAVSNSDGSITSSVSANTDAGFSIVSYTGTATNATVGHGLNSTPDVVVVKNRDTANEWHVKHKDLSSNNNSVRFNSNAHQADFSVWQNTAPTSTVFSIGTQDGVNKSGADFIAYCWHSVPGFSKFGSYTGNGSSNNMGTFIDLGFKPALVWIKAYSHAGNWNIYDTARQPNNPAEYLLLANEANQQNNPAGQSIDILSNGFKCRGANAAINESYSYIYFAWAEHPFGGENAAPATAR